MAIAVPDCWSMRSGIHRIELVGTTSALRTSSLSRTGSPPVSDEHVANLDHAHHAIGDPSATGSSEWGESAIAAGCPPRSPPRRASRARSGSHELAHRAVGQAHHADMIARSCSSITPSAWPR